MTNLVKRYKKAQDSLGSGQRFGALSGNIQSQQEAKGKNPKEAKRIADATAAAIGRAKYGNKKFSALSKRARMMK